MYFYVCKWYDRTMEPGIRALCRRLVPVDHPVTPGAILYVGAEAVSAEPHNQTTSSPQHVIVK